MTETNLPAVRNQIDWTPDQVKLLQDTIAKGSTPDEFKMFLMVCKQTGLNPFMRQIHMVKRWDSKLQRESATVQVAIDGFRVIADRSGQYAGQDEPKFGYDDNGGVLSCTVTVHRIIQGQRVPFTATAFFEEYVQTKKDGSPTQFWAQKPRLMLAKCAESLALRKAFPQDLSGLYTDDEMPDHVDTHTGEVTEQPKPKAVKAAPEPTPDMFAQLQWFQMAEDLLIKSGMTHEKVADICRATTGKSVDQLEKATPVQRRNYKDALTKALASFQLELADHV